MHKFSFTIECVFFKKRLVPSGDDYYPCEVRFVSDIIIADNFFQALDLVSFYCESNFPDCDCTIFSISRIC